MRELANAGCRHVQLDEPVFVRYVPDVLAFGIGGEVRYTLPGIMPMALYFHGHYSPDITSFGDIEEIIDYRFGFQIEVLPQTTAFVGVRHIELATENDGDVEIDDDRLHIGVRLTF